MSDETDLIKLGNQVIKSGWLRTVRQEFSLSMVSLAQLLGSYAATVKSWEDGSATLVWKDSARKAAAFYLAYLETLAKLDRAKISPSDLMPLRTASMYLGKPAPAVQGDCVSGDLTCLDLGALGVYVWKEDVGR